MLRTGGTGFNVVVVSFSPLSSAKFYIFFIYRTFFMGEEFISGSTGFKSSLIVYPSQSEIKFQSSKYTILHFPHDTI